MLAFALLILITHFFIPGSQPFEANLLVSHLQFTYSAPSPRLFLQNIDNLAAFDLQTTSETLTLTGTFTSPDYPEINSILSKKKELSFTFYQTDSRLLFYPSTPKSIALLELTLNPNSKVNLSYLSYPPETPLNLGLTSSIENSTEPLATVQLQLNPEPFILGLENVTIEGLERQPTELQFTPNAPFTPELLLFSPTQLFLSFAENTQPEREWIRGNLPVTDVDFQWVDRTGDLRNDFPRSAILKGEVRMRENTLTLQEHQFLITANDQDIQKLRYFALSSDPSVGVQVRLAGESQELAVGLDPDYPVQTLIPSWLSRYLTPDEITAALSFCAAVIGFLLPYLFTPSSEN